MPNIAIIEHTRGLGVRFLLENYIKKWDKMNKVIVSNNTDIKGCDFYFTVDDCVISQILKLKKMYFKGIAIWYKPDFRNEANRIAFMELLTRDPTFTSIIVTDDDFNGQKVVDLCDIVMVFERKKHCVFSMIQPYTLFYKYPQKQVNFKYPKRVRLKRLKRKPQYVDLLNCKNKFKAAQYN